MANPDEEHGWYTYDKLAPLLIKHMQENGYNCVELMPISEHPCDESWGYQNTGFFAPTSRYGTAKQFQQMIDLFHKNNIYVLLDFVPVHFAMDAYGLANYDGTSSMNTQMMLSVSVNGEAVTSCTAAVRCEAS